MITQAQRSYLSHSIIMPSMSYVDADDVRINVDRGDGTLGNLILPPEANVSTADPGYGANGTEFEGSCHVPAASDVREGVPVGQVLGTLYVLPDVENPGLRVIPAFALRRLMEQSQSIRTALGTWGASESRIYEMMLPEHMFKSSVPQNSIVVVEKTGGAAELHCPLIYPVLDIVCIGATPTEARAVFSVVNAFVDSLENVPIDPSPNRLLSCEAVPPGVDGIHKDLTWPLCTTSIRAVMTNQ